MTNIIQLRLPREVSKCLYKMHIHAEAGTIRTFAFIAVTPDGYMADVCGEIGITPEMLRQLQAKIIRRQRRAAG